MADLEKKIQSALKAPFSVKSWRDHRESAAKGSGVAKAISALEGLGMDARGSLKKVEDGKLKATLQGYENILLPAIQKAQAKCKRAKFTEQVCKYMIEDMKKHAKDARKRLSAIEGSAKQEYAKKEQGKKDEQEAQKADKELAGLLKDMAVQMSKLKTVFDNATKSMKQAHVDMKKLMSSDVVEGQTKINMLGDVFAKADKAYTKPVESAGKFLISNIKLRKTMGKVTKKSNPVTIKMEQQFNKVVEVLKQSRATAQSANSETSSFLANSIQALKKDGKAKFASV